MNSARRLMLVLLAGLSVTTGLVYGAEESYSVLVSGYDMDWKIRGIKAIREETGLGLADAKKLIESKDGVVKSGLSKVEADALAKRLQAQRVVVVVKRGR